MKWNSFLSHFIHIIPELPTAVESILLFTPTRFSPLSDFPLECTFCGILISKRGSPMYNQIFFFTFKGTNSIMIWENNSREFTTAMRYSSITFPLVPEWPELPPTVEVLSYFSWKSRSTYRFSSKSPNIAQQRFSDRDTNDMTEVICVFLQLAFRLKSWALIHSYNIQSSFRFPSRIYIL